MKIQVKLFANFRDYLPPGSEKYSCWVELEEGASISRVLEKLNIPESIPMITLVDGIHRATDQPLHTGEVLSVFPPVAGG